MRFALILSLMMALAPWDAGAQEVFQKGPFTVRKLHGICKLEIAMQLDGRPAAILALFPGDTHYDELFTEKERIGLARDQVVVQFDREPPIRLEFTPDLASGNQFWEWQYLKGTGGLLDQVKRRSEMEIRFSNGQKEFQFSVSLKGSSKAAQALRSCNSGGGEGTAPDKD
ncbi:MAG: hypothetical protein HQL82_02925 [Magnetococcales bacterium]|nr:hypothetical protein [Magnetococcales bacterium]